MCLGDKNTTPGCPYRYGQVSKGEHVAANFKRAVKALRDLYDLPFGGKRRGRLVLTREQVAQILAVKKLHEGAVAELQIDALEEQDLVVAELADQLYGVIDVAVAARWRRVRKKSCPMCLARPPQLPVMRRRMKTETRMSDCGARSLVPRAVDEQEIDHVDATNGFLGLCIQSKNIPNRQVYAGTVAQ